MLKIDPEQIDTQRIGRMGELVVELELIARGWHVGNFNSSTNNSAGWDVFAAREGKSVKLRVKAKRPGTECFRWSAKSDGTLLYGLCTDDRTDFVAAVSFEDGGGYHVYIIPSETVETELESNHSEYLSIPKRDGGQRKNTAQRNLYINNSVERHGHGYRKKWAKYRGAWDQLIS